MESHTRSIVKSVCWRFFALIITSLVGWLLTGSARMGLAIGGADFAVKIVTYYLHERLWQRVRWGVAMAEEVREGEGI